MKYDSKGRIDFEDFRVFESMMLSDIEEGGETC